MKSGWDESGIQWNFTILDLCNCWKLLNLSFYTFYDLWRCTCLYCIFIKQQPEDANQCLLLEPCDHGCPNGCIRHAHGNCALVVLKKSLATLWVQCLWLLEARLFVTYVSLVSTVSWQFHVLCDTPATFHPLSSFPWSSFGSLPKFLCEESSVNLCEGNNAFPLIL